MKSILLYFLIFLPLLPLSEFRGKVTSIKDGDTIEVLYENKPIRIRLNGIDCPEKDQDFGQKAKQFTSDLCFGKEVKVISHGEDRYGRTLGDIILEDGRNLNQELVKAGLAWHYKKYSSDPILADLEIQARNQKKGLWIQPNAIAPWDYRKNSKKASSQTPFKKSEIDTTLRYKIWEFKSSNDLGGQAMAFDQLEIIDFSEKGKISLISERSKIKSQAYSLKENVLIFFDASGKEIKTPAVFQISKLTKEDLTIIVTNGDIHKIELHFTARN